MTVNIVGPQADMKWYDIYAAAVAVVGVCVRLYQNGFAVLYGERGCARSTISWDCDEKSMLMCSIANQHSTMFTVRFDDGENLSIA